MSDNRFLGMSKYELRIQTKKCQLAKLAQEIKDMEAGLTQEIEEMETKLDHNKSSLAFGLVAPEYAGQVVNHKIRNCRQASIVKEIEGIDNVNHMLGRGWTIISTATSKKGLVYLMGTSHKDRGLNVYDNKGRTI